MTIAISLHTHPRNCHVAFTCGRCLGDERNDLCPQAKAYFSTFSPWALLDEDPQ